MTGHRAWFLIAALIAALVVPATATPQRRSELERVEDIYRAIVAYQVLFDRDEVSRELVQSALWDVEHYVAELDSRLATDELFIDDPDELSRIREWVAKAHLQAALLHARGVDLEASIVEFEKVTELLGRHPSSWDVEIERRARRGTLPEVREVVYEMARTPQVVDDLRTFWSTGVVTRFVIDDLGPDARRSLVLERTGGRVDPFYLASWELARTRFAERVVRGEHEVRVVLPPGEYALSSSTGAVPRLALRFEAGQSPDPVIVGTETFSFRLATADTCRPRILQNGVALGSLVDLPFGTFTIEAPRGCARRLPDKITVTPGPEVTVRTEPEKLDYAREGEPIFLFVTTPPGSVYTLRM
ncbi:MAG: hypothetical protein D6738_07430 [Acidobacteria bacterium]|nr:MAG: hypothetical protein D6738_07430 [Acidobacteriota bacterium]